VLDDVRFAELAPGLELPLTLAKEECAAPSAPVVDAATAAPEADFRYPAERELSEGRLRLPSLLKLITVDEASGRFRNPWRSGPPIAATSRASQR
jgi:hypothetical protein